MTLDNLELL